MREFLIIITWFGLSFLAGRIASNKGRSFGGFFLLALLLSPLIGIIAALVSKPDIDAVEKMQTVRGEAKKCPHCAEMIKWEAVVCRFCGKEVPSLGEKALKSTDGWSFGPDKK
jgi:hypothetical protein